MATKTNTREALRLLREYHKMSQTELAEKMGVSNAHISMLESGQKTPSVGMLDKYAATFDVPVSAIVFLGEQLTRKPITRPVNKTIHKTIIAILNWLADKDQKND
jgi:transcriptional regulator with XRE-family HTH domain